MARSLKLFQWTGWAPRGVEREDDPRPCQVHCAVVLPSKAAFKRLTDSPESRFNYVSTLDLGERTTFGNPAAQAAFEKPGTVFFLDDVRHPHRDMVVAEHPAPEFS